MALPSPLAAIVVARMETSTFQKYDRVISAFG
jgi:hypothetical protein